MYADATYGQPLVNPVSLNNYGGQPTNTGWTVYTIPLSDLSAANRTIRDFTIHEARGVNQAALYVDQVELVGSGSGQPTPTLTATPTITPTPTPTPATVRKSVYDMTPAEWTRFVNALNTLRANGTYNQFMIQHLNAMGTLTQPNDTTTQRNVAIGDHHFCPGIVNTYGNLNSHCSRLIRQ